MPDAHSGSEQFTDEDRPYAGSRFREVVDALFANPYQNGVGPRGRAAAAEQEQTIRTVFGGLLASAGRPASNATARTLDSGADLRWGPDGRGSRGSFIRPASASWGGGRFPKRRRIRDTSERAVRRSSLPGIRAAPEATGAAGFVRSRWSASCFRRGSRPSRAAANRELHHPAGHRRGADRVDQRRRAAERAGRDRVPTRPRRHAADQGGVRVPAHGSGAHHPAAVSGCRAGQARRRADESAGLHGTARRARSTR